MEDAQRVGGVEAVGDLDADGEDQLEAGRPASDELVKRLARNVLHDDEALVTTFADFVNGADIGVFNGRGEARFAQNSRAQLLGREQAGAENFKTTGRWRSRSLAR